MIASSNNRECRHGYACLNRHECNNAYGVPGYDVLAWEHTVSTKHPVTSGFA
jgi:hypothetical protein